MMNKLNAIKSVSMTLLFAGFMVLAAPGSCNDDEKDETTEQMEGSHDEHPSNGEEHPNKDDEHPTKKADTTKKENEHPK